MGPDEKARRVAARQDGVIHRRQLRRCGLTDTQIADRIASGHLIRLHRGVFLIGGAALTFRARLRAALLACGPGAVASHRSAAALWGFGVEPNGEVEVTVCGRNPRRRNGVRIHRPRHPLGNDVRTRHGFRCTSPARTICDLAAVATRRELEYAIQEAAVARLITQQELSAAAERARWRPGARLLQTILALERGVGFTRSDGERRLIALLDGAGLPRPEKNVLIRGYPVDAVWREERVIVEIDGVTTHGTAVAFATDRARDAELQAAGWRVLRFTYTQLRYEPLRVLRQLVRALDAVATQDRLSRS